MEERNKLKEYVKKRCEVISVYCDGAKMCSAWEKPLHTFANNIQDEMRTLISEVHNFTMICDDD